MQGGWGKIDAAASAQYAISRWRPSIVVNLGTCAGISGQIDKFDTVLACFGAFTRPSPSTGSQGYRQSRVEAIMRPPFRGASEVD